MHTSTASVHPSSIPDVRLLPIESDGEEEYIALYDRIQKEIVAGLKSPEGIYVIQYLEGPQNLFEDSYITTKDVFTHIAESTELTTEFARATLIAYPPARCVAQDKVINKAIEQVAEYFAAEEACALSESRDAA